MATGCCTVVRGRGPTPNTPAPLRSPFPPDRASRSNPASEPVRPLLFRIHLPWVLLAFDPPHVYVRFNT
eukprot:scaffold843_cov330-Pavlova_lutheri.AAC.3